MIQRSCECGAAIKLAGFADDPVLAEILTTFDSAHAGHERVAPADACRIRDTERKAGRELVS